MSLLATDQQRAIWDRMKAEHHPWVQTILANALMDGNADLNTSRYASLGRWAGLAYIITGETDYAARSLRQLKGDSSGFTRLLDGNGLREWGIEYNLLYDWIGPALSATDHVAFADYLRRVADSIIAAGIRFHDSDQMVGTYFFLALVDLNLGTDYLTRRIYDQDGQESHRVGGLDATENQHFSTMRNTLSSYCAMAEGGVWLESCQYNSGTEELLFLGAALIRAATGIEHFADIEVFRHARLQQLQHEFTPDGQHVFYWGDTEPHDDWIQYDGLLTHFPELLAWELELRTKIHRPRGTPLYPRFFYYANPYQIALPVGQSNLHIAPGMGMVYARKAGENRALHFWAQHMYLAEREIWGVDHFNGVMGDIRVYRDGQFVIDHPIGYMNEPVNHNILLVGRAASLDRGGLLDTQFEEGKFLRVTGWNAGHSPDRLAPEVIDFNIRTVHWLMESPDDVVVIIDHVQANYPATFHFHTPSTVRELERTANRLISAVIIGPTAETVITQLEAEHVRVTRPGYPDVLVPLAQPTIPSLPVVPTRATLKGLATASSALGGFAPANVLNGELRGLAPDGFTANNLWGTTELVPQWLRVDFTEPKTLTEVVVYSLQDNYSHPQTPYALQEFTLYGLVDFEIQVLQSDGTWITVATVRDNDRVIRPVLFPAITTRAVRVWVIRASDAVVRMVELEIIGTPLDSPDVVPPPVILPPPIVPPVGTVPPGIQIASWTTTVHGEERGSVTFATTVADGRRLTQIDVYLTTASIFWGSLAPKYQARVTAADLSEITGLRLPKVPPGHYFLFMQVFDDLGQSNTTVRPREMTVTA